MGSLRLLQHLTNIVLTEILIVSFPGEGQIPMKTDLK